MKSNKNNEKRSFKYPKIEEQEGFNVKYDKKELEKYFPHLVKEITNKKKSINIDTIDFETEIAEANCDNSVTPNSDELINPGVIEFLRRCTTKEEAIEILDYLFKRKELSQSKYHKYKNQIEQESGLKKIIDECGGLKSPGYYERKFRSKIYKEQ